MQQTQCLAVICSHHCHRSCSCCLQNPWAHVPEAFGILLKPLPETEAKEGKMAYLSSCPFWFHQYLPVVSRGWSQTSWHGTLGNIVGEKVRNGAETQKASKQRVSCAQSRFTLSYLIFTTVIENRYNCCPHFIDKERVFEILRSLPKTA